MRTAPQIELLKRAALCITHAGLNTALEALGQGVPMVAIPIGYDQPGVAARIAHHRVGEFLEIEDLTVERLRPLIQAVLDNPRYRDNSRWFQKVITQTRGLDVAADVIERAFKCNHRAGGNSAWQFGAAGQNIAAQADRMPLNGSNGAESATKLTHEHVPDISE